ncbi:hypothetical protein [Mycolicibacterium tokaiense]|uniref:hypothetical protein n=1 Tax=Mycolicibacterium tokaiense TaxID=39695 RepID=UPI00138C4B8E|nr:hypothetical protein [Mycolicibacterium tokaiense]BBY85154.1 hypothetical protein MTOK_09360 [Mycolicibacterium tokaiense]
MTQSRVDGIADARARYSPIALFYAKVPLAHGQQANGLPVWACIEEFEAIVLLTRIY